MKLLLVFLTIQLWSGAVASEIKSTHCADSANPIAKLEKNLKDVNSALDKDKCDFIPPDERRDWQKNKVKLIDFLKSFEGAVACPAFLVEGGKRQIYQDARENSELLVAATTSYLTSDAVEKAFAVRAAAVAFADNMAQLPVTLENAISEIKNFPSEIYESVSRWMTAADCRETFATQKGLCLSAGAILASTVGFRGSGKNKISNWLKETEKKAHRAPLDEGISKGNYKRVRVIEYQHSELTVSSFHAYDPEGQFYKGARNILMLGENSTSAPLVEKIAKVKPDAKIVAGGIGNMGTVKAPNVDLRTLDNTKDFPLEWENKFDRILMNRGLCVCECGGTTCGGVSTKTAEATAFLKRVGYSLDKRNTSSKAVLTANPLPMNGSGPDDLKVWVESASNLMKENPNLEVKIFQRNGRILQLEISPVNPPAF